MHQNYHVQFLEEKIFLCTDKVGTAFRELLIQQ
jgi:hypothetical protein